MADKEIIVGGVDVSECGNSYLSPRDNCVQCTNHVERYCAMHPNCYFKQLKQAEQKLEKIKGNCNETLPECSCKNPIIDIDCRECTNGGRVEKAKEILQIIEGEENE